MSLILTTINLVTIAIILYIHITGMLKKKKLTSKLVLLMNFACMLLIPSIQGYLFYVFITHSYMLFEYIVDNPGQNNTKLKQHALGQLIIFITNFFIWLGVHI